MVETLIYLDKAAPDLGWRRTPPPRRAVGGCPAQGRAELSFVEVFND